MTKLVNQLYNVFRQNQLFSLILSITLLFFVYKGVHYALIGSYVPLLFIIIILCLLMVGLNKSPNVFKWSVGSWSVLIILWATVRLLLSMANLFVKPVPEGHVDGQLGLASILLSVAFLIAGIYLWQKRKSSFCIV